MEVNDNIVISWSNVGKYCRVIFYFGVEGDDSNHQSDLKMLEREQPWEPKDMYGITQSEKVDGARSLQFIEKTRARKLWVRLQEEHNFYLADIEVGEEKDES